ncbi:hypothetical protein SAMN03159447_07030 [Variovorax sp. NFACC27]|nr:hypothetical protein SAMN03159447_07030 [Variovorax sp. NFACC27]
MQIVARYDCRCQNPIIDWSEPNIPNMPYYIRVLAVSDRIISASELAHSLKTSTLTVEAGTDEQWDQLLLAHENGQEIAVIERNPVSKGSMAAEEIEEFIDELQEAQPASGSRWLVDYLPRVKTIYAFQVLSGADEADGWSKLGSVKALLWNKLGGIFQADSEGFSNEDGYHIVWQFSERASGPWWMGLFIDGKWMYFEMDLANRQQREQFLRGELPAGVKLST